MDVRKQVLFVSARSLLFRGGWLAGELDNKANSVQLQLPIGNELGKNGTTGGICPLPKDSPLDLCFVSWPSLSKIKVIFSSSAIIVVLSRAKRT